MNNRVLVLVYFVIFSFFFLESTYAIECYNCSDCSSKLGTYQSIELSQNINKSSDKCIERSSISNKIIDCNGYNIIDGGSATMGIYLDIISNITIKNCNINGFINGIYLSNNDPAKKDTIENTTVDGSGNYGITLSITNNVTIKNTTVKNIESLHGIYLYKSNLTNITNSIINSNNAYGIRIYDDSDNNIITKNTITSNNKAGIIIDNYTTRFPDSNTIFDNRIRGNSRTETSKYEIVVEAGCANNNVSLNALKYSIDDKGTNTALSRNIYSDLVVGKEPYFIVDYDGIGSAISGASPYDMIHVMPGIYSECLSIRKPVHLKGESRENTNITCAGDTVRIGVGADGAQVRNFTIKTTDTLSRAIYAGDASISVSNITIAENILISPDRALFTYNIANSIIYRNYILGDDSSAYLSKTTHTNISYNFFQNDIEITASSENNNLWMNNFTYRYDTYNENENDYCVFGLDNNYHEYWENYPPLSCESDFSGAFNDSAIYQNETVLFSVDTSSGESNYTHINATIDGTNYTLALTGGDSIDGIWTCAFSETGELGRYSATALYYIEADGDEGSSTAINAYFNVSDLELLTGVNATVTNATGGIRIRANVSGNATGISNVLAQVYWNNSLRHQNNMTLEPGIASTDGGVGENVYKYYLDYYHTERSGNYTVNITAFAAKTRTNTQMFFVNYGRAEVTLHSIPQKVQNGNKTTQTYLIKAIAGDLANVSSTIAINDTSVLDITGTENRTKNTSYIFSGNTTTLSWEIEGKSAGVVRLNATTDTTNGIAAANKTIEVTALADTEPPEVRSVWTQYESAESRIFNLKDSTFIYANITDEYQIESVKANITMPDNTTVLEITLEEVTGLQNIYKGEFPDTNQTSRYNITVIASDGTNINDTEIGYFTVTDRYPAITISTYSLYNRGENATINITVYGINNNRVSGFNTSLNITYENTTTILLENNNTDTYRYYINTTVLGIHNISANITKNGNIGANTSTLNATNVLDMSFYTSLTTYSTTSKIRDLYLYTYYARGNESPYLNDVNAVLYCYNNTNENMEYVPLSKSTANQYTYTTSGDPQCYAAKTNCKAFEITANITDAYNNSGTTVLNLNTDCLPQDPSSSTGGGGSGGIIQNATETVKEIVIVNQTNITTSDFDFTLNKKEITLEQGKDTTIIGTLNNRGDVPQKITSTITKQCCNITTEKTIYYIPPKNKEDIVLKIHNSLKTPAGEYLIKITMAAQNITKTETIRITIEKNKRITDLENLESKIKEQLEDIESYTEAGTNVEHLRTTVEEIESLISKARQHIEDDNLNGLESTVTDATGKSNYVELELVRLKTVKWLMENKYNILIAAITLIIILYISVYFIIPFVFMKKELTQLRTKEIELKDAEKSVQRQYFMRQLDEPTFNKLMGEKHSLLLDVRSEIRHIEEKLTLLKKGKLDLKEHDKYFILNRIRPKKELQTDKKIQIREKIKSLKEQEYNILLSAKESEKNYYSRIITLEELEQIIETSREKIERIRNELYALEQQTSALPEDKHGVTEKIKQKYNEYKHRKEKIKAEKKIQKLKEKEEALKKKDEDNRSKEREIEDEIESIKKDNLSKEQE